MFEIYQNGKPAVEVKPWTVEQAIDKYLAKAQLRVEDSEQNYGPASYANQQRDLKFISLLNVDGLTLAKREIRDLNVEFIEDDFWPELKRQRHGSLVTALNRFSSFRQMMQFCVKKKQLPVNVCYQADITPPERAEVDQLKDNVTALWNYTNKLRDKVNGHG